MHNSPPHLLLWTAVTVALLHTVVGVDHWLPFIVLGRAQRWPFIKLLSVTALCGLGHVLSSVALAGVGIVLGVGIEGLEIVDGRRGQLASWLLIGFGLAYMSWAIYRKARRRPHHHIHLHGDGTLHDHHHVAIGEHLHPHGSSTRGVVTLWTLFVVMVLGPCEPLIPLVMVPAMSRDWTQVAMVTAWFGVTTVAAMLVMVTLGYVGLSIPVSRRLEDHAHALAGASIVLAGVAVRQFGL